MTTYEKFENEALVSLLRESDHKAFSEIYNRFWKQLYYLAFKLLGTTELAEDTVQDVFLNLWAKRADIRVETLHLYLAAMTRYAVYRQLAKMSKESTKKLNGTEIISNEYESMDQKLLLDLIGKFANHLPEKCRLVFTYNKLLDHSVTDVARLLQMSPKTVEAHLTKALKVIRGKLGQQLNTILFL